MKSRPPFRSSAGDHRQDLSGLLRFVVIGAISHAAHYVIANWPTEVAKPVFDTTCRPMSLTFAVTKQAVRTLQETLVKAMIIGGPIANSARAFRMLLATKLAGRVIPDLGSALSESDSQAG